MELDDKLSSAHDLKASIEDTQMQWDDLEHGIAVDGLKKQK